jgi:hypothetical protein
MRDSYAHRKRTQSSLAINANIETIAQVPTLDLIE